MCDCKFEIKPKRLLSDLEKSIINNRTYTPIELEKLWNDVFQPSKYYKAASCSKCYERIKTDLINYAKK